MISSVSFLLFVKIYPCMVLMMSLTSMFNRDKGKGTLRVPFPVYNASQLFCKKWKRIASWCAQLEYVSVWACAGLLDCNNPTTLHRLQFLGLNWSHHFDECDCHRLRQACHWLASVYTLRSWFWYFCCVFVCLLLLLVVVVGRRRGGGGGEGMGSFLV